MEQYREQRALCEAQALFEHEWQEIKNAAEAVRLQQITVDQGLIDQEQLEIDQAEVGRTQQLMAQLELQLQKQIEELEIKQLQLEAEKKQFMEQQAELERQRWQVQVDRDVLEESMDHAAAVALLKSEVRSTMAKLEALRQTSDVNSPQLAVSVAKVGELMESFEKSMTASDAWTIYLMQVRRNFCSITLKGLQRKTAKETL